MKNTGQITIEFILTFMFAVLFVLLFLYYSINFATGYMAHYATYLASRAYLTGEYEGIEFNSNQPYRAGESIGREAFDSIGLEKMGLTFSADDLKFNSPQSVRVYEYVGAYFKFTPPFRISSTDSKNSLLSESFLGKEPSKGDCECQIKKAMGFGQCSNVIPANETATLFDNGC